jgi:thioester reductase-like protein
LKYAFSIFCLCAHLISLVSGFLGLHILKRLLDAYRTVENFKVFVLIRGGNAEERLWALAGQYGLPFCEESKACVVVVNGELGRTRFGLSEVQFEKLANSVDIVIHNGATVNWLLDYKSLKSSNVVGTLEALRLCALGNNKRFIFVSSISAFLQGEEKLEDISYDVPAAAMNTMNGYGSTKRISDILVEQAVRFGLDGYICRPGTIGWSLETGHCNQNDTINRFLQTVCQTGYIPDEVNDYISIAPVDVVATIICAAASLENCPRAFTIIGDPISTSDLTLACSKRSGIKINKVPLREFYDKISSQECTLSPLISFFENAAKLPIQNERDVYNCSNFDKVATMIQSSCYSNAISGSSCKYEKSNIESYLGKLVF